MNIQKRTYTKALIISLLLMSMSACEQDFGLIKNASTGPSDPALPPPKYQLSMNEVYTISADSSWSVSVSYVCLFPAQLSYSTTYPCSAIVMSPSRIDNPAGASPAMGKLIKILHSGKPDASIFQSNSVDGSDLYDIMLHDTLGREKWLRGVKLQDFDQSGNDGEVLKI